MIETRELILEPGKMTRERLSFLKGKLALYIHVLLFC